MDALTLLTILGPIMTFALLDLFTQNLVRFLCSQMHQNCKFGEIHQTVYKYCVHKLQGCNHAWTDPRNFRVCLHPESLTQGQPEYICLQPRKLWVHWKQSGTWSTVWLGRVLRHQNFFRDIIEGKMMGKLLEVAKMQLLHDIMEGKDYGQLKDLISGRPRCRKNSKWESRNIWKC